MRSLPPVAVRGALVNALVHADYAQRGAPVRVSEAVRLSVCATRQRLAALGEVREIGSEPTDPQRRYFRADG